PTAARKARRTSASTGAKPRSSETTTRSSPGAGAGVDSGTGGRLCRSRGSKPATAVSIRRASATVRASGPSATSVFQPGDDGSCGTSPKVGLNPTTPQNAAGIRIEPPPSPPSDSGPQPAATAAAAPPEDPPAVRPTSHGFAVRPNSSDP